MTKKDLAEEAAKREYLKAKTEYSLACSKLAKARKMIPPEEYRSLEETAFWKLLRLKVSNTAKAVKKAEQEWYLSRVERRETETVEKIRELIKELEAETAPADIPEELARVAMRYNLSPKGGRERIEKIPGAAEIIAAIQAKEALKEAAGDLDILPDGLAGGVPPWEDPEMLAPHPDLTPVVPIAPEPEAQKEQERADEIGSSSV